MVLFFQVVLDLKGTQYTGRLFPGPTALVLSLATNSTVGKKASDEEGTAAAEPYLKVDGITDEFCSLTRTGDAMASLGAFSHYEEEDVNRLRQPTAETVASATSTIASQPEQSKKRKKGQKSNPAPAIKKKKATKTKK